MRLSDSMLFSLDGHVAAIWNLIQNPIYYEEIVSRLMHNFEVTQQQCEDDCLASLSELMALGLIVSSNRFPATAP